MMSKTLLTASNFFLIAAAISLQTAIRVNLGVRAQLVAHGLLDCLEKGFAVVDLVGYTAEDVLEVLGPVVELLELDALDEDVFVGRELLRSQNHFVHVNGLVEGLKQLVDELVREAGVHRVDLTR
jgi:hypothetical protein